MSVSPSQSKPSTVTRDQGGGLMGLCPATVESKLQWKGKELAEK